MRGLKLYTAVALALAAPFANSGASAQTPGPAPSPVAGAAALPAQAPVAAPAQPAISESVVVTVNDELISSYDIIQRMRLLIVTAGIQPNEQNIPELQREAIRSLVDERLEMKELRSQGKSQKFDLIAGDDEVNEEIASIARANNTSAAQLLGQLSAQGVSAQTFREQLRAEISWRGWIRGRYGQRLKIGDDQVKAFQKRLEAEAGKPQYQIAEVFIDANRAGGAQQAVAGAQSLIGQIQRGAPFNAVARQFSNSPSAANGGDVGWVSTGELPPEVDRVLADLRPGQMSAPIPVQDGAYIVLLRDKRSGSDATVVHLKQAALQLPKTATAEEVAAATAKLETMSAKLHGCDNIEVVAGRTPGVVAGDLGETDTKDLAPAFKTVVDTLQAGQISKPVRTDAGMHVLAVCEKHAGGAGTLTRDQIEDRLFGQELAMIAKRALRDLRNSATIESR